MSNEVDAMQDTPPPFLAGGGTMGALIRNHPWHETPLGPPDHWPQSLRSALSICLNSSFPTAIYWGPDLRLFYNDAWAHIPAERHPWALGRPGGEVWHEIWDVVGPQFANSMRTGEALAVFDEKLMMLRNGFVQETYWNYSFTPIRGESGEVYGVFNQGHETTERIAEARRARFLLDLGDALRDQAQPRAAALHALGALAAHLGAEGAVYGRLAGDGSGFVREAGWRTPDAAADALSELDMLVELHRDALAAGTPVLCQDRSRHDAAPARAHLATRAVMLVPMAPRSGILRVVCLMATTPRAWTDGDAALVASAGQRTRQAVERIHAGIEAARAEERLRQSEERMRLMADAVPQLVWIIDSRGRNEFMNRQWYEYTGAIPGEHDVNSIAVRFLHPDDRQRTLQAVAQARHTGSAFEYEHRILSRHGEYRWFLVRGVPDLDEAGRVLRWFGASTDIHDRRLAEAELVAERDRAQRYLEVAEVMILALDDRGRIEAINRRGVEIMGYPDAESLIGRNWFDVAIPADQRDEIRTFFSEIMAGRQPALSTRESRVLRADGTERWIAWRNSLLTDANGTATGTLSSGDDVTEQRLARERERLLGQEIDHRAKNLLAVVQSVVQLTRAGDMQAFRDAVTGRIESLARTHSLIAATRWQGADLRQIVSDELAPYGRAEAARVTIDGPHLQLTPPAAQTIAMVIHEMATNSAKHGALSLLAGRLAVEWHLEGAGEDAALRIAWEESGGPSVVAPTRRGFGTVVIRKSVEQQLRGRVELDWRPDGLRALFSIPVAKAVAAAAAPAPAAAEAAPEALPVENGPPLRVLVLEDEPLIAAQIESMLAGAGHTVVLSTSHVAEAQRKLGEVRPDAAILDINVGGASSHPLAERLLAEGVPFVFCSGYGEAASLPEALARIPVLDKPLRAADLVSAVARMAAARHRSKQDARPA